LARVQLSAQAANDLADLGPERHRAEDLLAALAQQPRPANLDIKALRGRATWYRARVGPYRLIVRPLAAEESSELGTPGARGYLVARIVHRRDLERIVRRL